MGFRIIGLMLLASSFAFGQAPTVTTISPTKGNIGSSVVITGTGFGATAANNIVWFGGVRGAITAGSATSITVKVPAGASPGQLTVLNTTSGLQIKSAAIFNVTFAGGVVNQCAYSNDVADFAFTGGSTPSYSFLAADLNNDGKPELVNMALFYPYIWVIPNQSTPGSLTENSFGDTLRYYIGGSSASAKSIAVGDLDGDGKIDIAVGNGNPAGVTLLRNTSSGAAITFAPRVQVAGFTGGGMVIVDLDFDGKPEIISGSTVYRNTSTPGALSFVAVTMTYAVDAIAVADLDADNKPDLAYTSANVLYASRNTGTIAPFTSSFFNTRITVGAYPQVEVAIADVDVDGKPDLMTMDNYSGQDSLFIYKNATTATLSAASFPSRVAIGLEFPDPTGAHNLSTQVTSADIDGDGKVDLVVLDRTSIPYQQTSTIGILRNNTTPGTITPGSFTRESFQAGENANRLLVVDADADGRLDFITSRIEDDGYVMTAFRNTMTETLCSITIAGVAPLISGFSPFSGARGSSITITGSNFNSDPTKMSVFFGGIKGTVTTGSATSLTVTVPNGVVNERLIVLDTQTRLQAKTTDHFSVTSVTHPITAAYYNATKDILIATNLSGSEPSYVSHADFDQDGKYDLIHRYSSLKNIHTTRNQSTSSSFSFPVDGQFRTQYIYDPGFPINDLNGDGKPEMIGASYTALNFWTNNYSGGLLDSTSFGPRQRRIGGGYSGVIAHGDFADFDGDGRPDMLLNGLQGQYDQSGGFSILRNLSVNGGVSFSSKIIFTQTVGSGSGIGDINGDGKSDFVMIDASVTNTVLIFQNQASVGSISPSDFLVTSIALGGPAQYYYSIYVTDLDGDHKPDIILSHTRGLTILKNIHTTGAISPGSFAAPIEITNASLLNGDPQLKIVDLDGDAKQELVFVDVDGFFVYKNNTTPGTITAASFAAPVNLFANIWVSDIADLNGDGVPELIAYAGGNLEIRYNGTVLPPNSAPVITSSTNTGHYVDTPITIDNTITLTDADDASLSGATMTISSSTLQTAEDKLVFSNQNGISGSYNSSTGVLTLTGTATIANYQTALRTIQYQNTSATPNTTARTITLTVTDGKDVSNSKSYAIDFQVGGQPGNAAPVITAQTENVALHGQVNVDLTQLISDPDGNLDLSTLTIVTQPLSGAEATLSATHQLTVDYTSVDFTGLDQLTIGVCDLDDLCSQQTIKIEVNGSELVVYNAVSPNGDHKNDSFWIDNVSALPDTRKNHVSIYNRWGDMVFEIDDYDNTTHAFDGRSKNGSALPSGTYFYKIQFASGKDTMTGYLKLTR